MKRILIGIASAMLVWSATAYGWGSSGPSWPSDSLSIGDQFVTVTVQCGTIPYPNCPGYSEPIGQRFLLRYVITTGHADMNCPVGAGIERAGVMTPLTHLDLEGDTTQIPKLLSWDNSVLTFPKPLRGEAGDKLAVFRARTPAAGERCATHAIFGIEYLR